MGKLYTHEDFPISKYLTAKAAAQGIPLHGVFELTSRCNFNCKMCYIHGIDDMEKLRRRELSVEQWIEIAEEARKQGLLFLLLTGGEAMLRDDFAQLYEALAQMGFRLVVNTNGSLMTNEILDLFQKYPPGRVNVSVYGASDETYGRLCGNCAKEKVVKAVQDMKKIGLSVRTTMTVTPYNCEDMKAVFEFSREEDTLLEMTSYLFPPVRRNEENKGENTGRFSADTAGYYMVEKERLSMTPEQFHEQAVKIVEYCEQEAAAVDKGKIPEVGNSISCQAGKSSFWLTWDGKMRICGLTTAPEVDVTEFGFSKSWEMIRVAAGQIRLPAECSVCPRKGLCRICAAMCQTETGRFDGKPQYVCDMSAAMLRAYQEEAERT